MRLKERSGTAMSQTNEQPNQHNKNFKEFIDIIKISLSIFY